MALAYIGMGSNLGDRQGHLDAGLRGIRQIGRVLVGSSLYETAPIGGIEQGAFLNAVIGIETDYGPEELLTALLAIEASSGRLRDVRWGPRTLDLDLLWYDGIRLDAPGLTVPHPEIRDRRFVLVPLVQADPRIGDEVGLYADSLGDVSDQAIRRVSGPLEPGSFRWLVGLEDAVALSPSGDGWVFDAHPDWANSSGDMFGAYISAVSLFAMREVAPEMSPVALVHRFLGGVPVASGAAVAVAVDRRTQRSIDAVVTVTVDGRLVGRSMISCVASVPATAFHPVAPEVDGIQSTIPIGDLIVSLGGEGGPSATNWGPLENWGRPDLRDGLEPVLRLWSPNAALGSNDPFLTAASMLMPIDAAIWPATMQNMGLLPSGPAIATPTVEFSATFADLDADDLFHLAEATIEHRTATSVSGTVRLWGDDGGYRATGRSSNLIRRRKHNDVRPSR